MKKLYKFLNFDKSNFFYSLLIILWCSLWFMSCGESYEEMRMREKSKQNGTLLTAKADAYDIIKIDSCEYLIAGRVPNNWHVITHKGDCKNPIHKCNCK